MEITDRESNFQIIKDFNSNLISSFSGNMFSFALGLMLLNATGLSISFGLSMIIMPIVNLIGLISIGNLVDSHRHKPLLTINLGVRICALIIYALIINQFHGVGKIFPTVLFLIVNYATVSISNSGYTASVHELVNINHIQKLNSLSQSAISLATIFSPVVAASFYAVVGFDAFIKFELFANGCSLAILLSMHFHYQPALPDTLEDQQKSQLDTFKKGLHYIMSEPFLKYLIVGATIINFFFPVINVGLPFMIVRQMHAGNQTLGVLNAMVALGMLIGNLLITLIPEIKQLTKILVTFFLTMSFSVIALGLVLQLTTNRLLLQALGGTATFITGFSLSFLNTPISIYLQKTVPPRLIGRVSTTLITTNMTSIPIGTLFFTVLFQIFPSGLNFIFTGIALTGFSLYLGHLLIKVKPRPQFAVDQETDLNNLHN